MCGIAGYHDPGGLREESALSILGAMTSVLQHRGPDDCGVWCDPPAGVAFGLASALFLAPFSSNAARRRTALAVGAATSVVLVGAFGATVLVNVV